MSIDVKLEVELELLNNGIIHVKETRRFFEHGKELAVSKPHRRVIMPGESLEELPKDSQKVIKTHWTKERIRKWEALKKAEREEEERMLKEQEKQEKALR